MDPVINDRALPYRQLGGEHIWDHYIPMTHTSAMADVAGRV